MTNEKNIIVNRLIDEQIRNGVSLLDIIQVAYDRCLITPSKKEALLSAILSKPKRKWYEFG